jgi:hypothetical protein
MGQTSGGAPCPTKVASRRAVADRHPATPANGRLQTPCSIVKRPPLSQPLPGSVLACPILRFTPAPPAGASGSDSKVAAPLKSGLAPTTCRVPLEVTQRPNDRVPDPRARHRDFTDLVRDVVHDAKVVAGPGKIDRSLDFTFGRAGLQSVDYHNRYPKAGNPGRCDKSGSLPKTKRRRPS